MALIALRIFGAILAVVATLVGTSILVLRTNWGGERLRRLAVSQVNKQIQGSLDIKRLSFRGDKVVAWGVALRDPDQQLVAQVARAEVDFALMRVLHKEIRLTAFVIETPLLTLVSDEQGLNLSRATAPRKKPSPKAPAPPKNTKEGWVMRLDRFDLAQGDLTMTVATASRRETTVHLAGLRAFASVRYATGNGSLDLTLRLDGQSQLVPTGPLRLACGATVRGDTYRFDVNGDLLGGTLKARGDVDGKHLDAADGFVALAIPRQALAGHDWGPLRVDARAHPATVPRLDVLLAIPGVAFAVKDRGQDTFKAEGHLSIADLALTVAALHALTGMDAPPLAGRGELTFGVGDPAAGAQTGFGGHLKGAFESLSSGDSVISHLDLMAQAAHLSAHPGSADLELRIASVSAGTTQLRGIAVVAKVRGQDVSATAGVAAPARVDASLGGRLDDDRQGFALASLAVAFPGGRWASEGTARLRWGDALSVSKLRLTSERQVLAVDGWKRGGELDAHLALTRLRLGQLPTALIDPDLHLDGELDADVKADGQMAAPNVVARLDLRQARYQGYSKIDAQVAATLREQNVDGTARVEAPFLKANAAYKLPVDLMEPGAPLSLRLDVKRLDIGDVVRGAKAPASGGGRVNLKVRVDGSADQPTIDVTAEAFDLTFMLPTEVIKDVKVEVKAEAKAQLTTDTKPEAKAKEEVKEDAKPQPKPTPIDLGHARLHLTYADRAARAELDFASSHGGTLVVDAGTRVDLSYPHVAREGVAVRKLPLHGKVVTRDLEVGWLKQFNPRVESMGGAVTADAKLGGTVGDVEFIGDVHWKNGRVVTTAPPLTPPLLAGKQRPAPRPASPRRARAR